MITLNKWCKCIKEGKQTSSHAVGTKAFLAAHAMHQSSRDLPYRSTHKRQQFKVRGFLFLQPFWWMELAVWKANRRQLLKFDSVPRNPEQLSILDTFSVLPLFHKHRLCVFGIVGASVLQGRGRGLHRGGAGAAGLRPEEAVPRRDAGELPEPALSVWGRAPSVTRCQPPGVSLCARLFEALGLLKSFSELGYLRVLVIPVQQRQDVSDVSVQEKNLSSEL